MALVNDVKKEINAKIVYLGPKGAGKATALRFIYSRLKPDCRSELKCMAAGEHQMLFFDFSYPLPLRSDGYTVRFHIYTLIAGGESTPPWKMLLKGADGVILFADSSDGKMYGNLESCALLFDAFSHYGMPQGSVPIALQCNKRDLKSALPLAALKNELFPESSDEPLPVTALSGENLLEGLNRTIREVMLNLGQDGIAPQVAEEPAIAPASPGEDSGEIVAASAQHCTDDTSGFTIECIGKTETVDGSTISIPLRLTGGNCGKSVDFKVTVSVTI